jgi:thioredoxin reductase
LHRLLSGPRYAEVLVQRALAAGVRVACATTVTNVDDQGVDVTSRDGPQRIDARAVILATGARERPRAARGVAGDRPAGVFTTGQLQQWTYLERLPVGRRALVVGAEHVSFSAIMTLRHAHVKTVALVTELARHQSVRGAAIFSRAWAHVPVLGGTRVIEIIGSRRVQGVILEDIATGRHWREALDTVVFSGDWIPDHELARRSGLEMDKGTRGPATDEVGRTSADTLYAAGNLIHPVESADLVARWARDVADVVAAELAHRGATPPQTVRLHVEDPVSWVWPNRWNVGHRPTHLDLRTNAWTTARTLQLIREGHVLAEHRLSHGTPNRSLRVRSGFLDAVGDDDATVRLR